VSDSLSQQTLKRASSALLSNPIACLPEIVKLMRTLSGNSGQVSVSELADVIQKDAAVLAKVIGAANTIGYNPNSTPISSIHQAIHVIGYERIRSLAMSLMLIEQSSRSQSSDEQREMAAQALTAGCLAHKLAGSRLRMDPEQAFVCASLRNFGRIVMVTCMLDDYRNAQKLAEVRPDDEAYREIFGLTPLELGYELLKAANLPEDILLALRELPPETLAVLDTKPDAQMLMVSDFSARLASLTLADNLPAEEFMARVKDLAAAFEGNLPHIAGEIPDLVAAAGQQLDYYVRAFRLKSLPTKSLNRLKLRKQAFAASAAAASAPATAAPGGSSPDTTPPMKGSGLPVPDDIATAQAVGNTTAPYPVATGSTPAIAPAAGMSAAPMAGKAPASATVSRPQEWGAHLTRVNGLMSHAGASPDHIFSAVIQAVCQIMSAPEALLFIGPRDQHYYNLAYGNGQLFKSLGSRARIDVRDRTVLGVCLLRKENIMIHHAHDPKILPYVPDWLKENRGLGAYALLPLFKEQQAHGVMLVGWPEARQIELTADQVKFIRSLLVMACDSCRRFTH